MKYRPIRFGKSTFQNTWIKINSKDIPVNKLPWVYNDFMPSQIWILLFSIYTSELKFHSRICRNLPKRASLFEFEKRQFKSQYIRWYAERGAGRIVFWLTRLRSLGGRNFWSPAASTRAVQLVLSVVDSSSHLLCGEMPALSKPARQSRRNESWISDWSSELFLEEGG